MTAKSTPSSIFTNRNWKIKVSGYTGKEKLHTLIGYRRLTEILGEELTEVIITKATDKGTDKVEFKFRRGLKVTLYSK
jgi:hypothetical protein